MSLVTIKLNARAFAGSRQYGLTVGQSPERRGIKAAKGVKGIAFDPGSFNRRV